MRSRGEVLNLCGWINQLISIMPKREYLVKNCFECHHQKCVASISNFFLNLKSILQLVRLTNKLRCFWNLCLSRRLIQDPFGEKRGRFDYQGLLARLSATHRRIREKLLAEDERNENDSDSDTSSSGTDPDSQGSSHPWLPGQCRSQKWGQGLKSKATFFVLFEVKEEKNTECNHLQYN